MKVAVTDSESSAPERIWNHREGSRAPGREQRNRQERARRIRNDGRDHESLSGHTLSELTRRDENQTICGNKFDLGLKIVSHKIATQL